MRYFDTKKMVFVFPGTDGGERVKKYELRNIPVGKYKEDIPEKEIKAGDKKYREARQMVGYEYINIPEHWVEMKDDDPRCQHSITHVLKVIEGELVLKPKDETPEEEVIAQAWKEKKSERASEVDKIVVMVGDLEFDGDEESQQRMSRAITASENDEEVVMWKLHDNNFAEVTAPILKQALRLSGMAQTAIWSKYK